MSRRPGRPTGGRRGRAGAFAIAFLTASAAGLARADDDASTLRISATDKLEYRRFAHEGVREEAFRNRLEVSGYQGIFSAWLRLESLELSNAAVYDPYAVAKTGVTGEQRIDQTEVTKRLFGVETEHFRVQAGDVSNVFGRGLAMSVFEDEELNFDTRLEGVRARGENDLGAATVVAGSQLGNRFRGVFVEPRPFDLRGPWPKARARVGGSFVEAWGATANTDILPREQQSGGLAELVVGPATVYGEWVEREFPGKDGLGHLGKPGHGGFFSGEVTTHGVTFSAEHKDFYRFEHKYHDPPTTLRQHTWTSLLRVNGQILSDIPDDDVNGTLLQAEWAPGTFTSFLGSWAQLDKDVGSDRFREVYGEAKTTWREKVFLTGAAADSRAHLGTQHEERITGLGEDVMHLDDVNSITLEGEWAEVKRFDDTTFRFQDPRRFHDRIFAISYGRSPWLDLTVTREDTDEGAATEPRSVWGNVIAEINVADGHDVVLSYGSERGGWKCTGGVCFYEPEFEGMKIKWVGRF
ncbi:MAG: DUF6029 family protein [bacterium]